MEYRLVHARRDRQVDDADVERGAVLEDVIEGDDHVADPAVALIVQHFEDRQPCAWRHACPGSTGIESVAGDDAGHVRAMPVVVVRTRAVAEDVDEACDSLTAVAGGQIVMPGRDAGVDDGHADAGAVVAKIVADG